MLVDGVSVVVVEMYVGVGWLNWLMCMVFGKGVKLMWVVWLL